MHISCVLYYKESLFQITGHVVDSTADVAGHTAEEWFRQSVAMLLRGPVCCCQVFHCAKCCFEMILADEADNWQVFVSLASCCDVTTIQRRLWGCVVFRVSPRSVSRIIGECGTAIKICSLSLAQQFCW